MGWMDNVPLWDHHCHALVSALYRDDMEIFVRCLSEAPPAYPAPELENTVVFEEALWTAATALKVAPDVALVQKALHEVDYADYCRTLFHAAGYTRLDVDTGYSVDGAMSVPELSETLGLPVDPILRLESTAEALLTDSRTLGEWIERVQAVVAAARSNGYRGCKSIIAYRSGLGVYRVDEVTARERWTLMRKANAKRLEDQALLNYLLHALTPAIMTQGLPLQFHTGYGDPDTDLRRGDPLHLRDYLEEYTPAGHQVVLLHTYPYQRQAAYLTSVYPGVYADVSLASPLAASRAVHYWQELLELAPPSRVLFASDAHSRPESFVLAARFFRQSIDQFLDNAVAEHHVRAGVAHRWGEAMAFGNAARLYGRH